MKKILPRSLLWASIALASTSTYADIIVSNGNNSGSGSLRAALEQGDDDITINNSVNTIRITETLQYNSTRQLTINGSGQTIDASDINRDDDILSINQGADVNISNVNFIGNARNINQDSSNTEGGKGIFLSVPITQRGTVNLTLEQVSISRVGDHAVHVSDCSLRDACGSGSDGGGEGSDASLFVKFNNVTISNVGFGRQDGDGVRIDERGDGSISFRALRSSFLNAGADGIELDEGDDGDVITIIDNSVFDSNGAYCGMIPFDSGSPCDNDGDPDLDDAFDVDEAGDGSIIAEITNSRFRNNLDEGLDFDEANDGNIEITAIDFIAKNNVDEAIKASEEDDGDVIALLDSVLLVGNNDDDEGIELEEDNGGDLRVVIVNSNAANGNDEEIKLIEDNSGDGTVKVINSNVTLDLDNVDEI